MRKNSSYWAIQIFQNQGTTSSPLSWKSTITLCNIWAGFSNLADFLGTTPEKNELDYLMQNSMVNRLAPISNPKKQQARMLFSNFYFETNFVKWRFFLFYRPFWTVGKFPLSQSEAAKLAGSDKEKHFCLSNSFQGFHSKSSFYILTKFRLKNCVTTV